MIGVPTKNQNGFVLLAMTSVIASLFLITSMNNTRDLNRTKMNISIKELDTFVSYNKFLGTIFKNKTTCSFLFQNKLINPTFLGVAEGIDFKEDLGGGLMAGNRKILHVGQALELSPNVPDSGLRILRANLRRDSSVEPSELGTDEYATQLRYFAGSRPATLPQEANINELSMRRGFGGELTREIAIRMKIVNNRVEECFGVIEQTTTASPDYSDYAFCMMIDPTATFEPEAQPPVPKCQIKYLGVFKEEDRTKYGEYYKPGRIATTRYYAPKIIVQQGIEVVRGDEIVKPCLRDGTNCPAGMTQPESSGGGSIASIQCFENAGRYNAIDGYMTHEREPAYAFLSDNAPRAGEETLGCPYPYLLMDFTIHGRNSPSSDGGEFHMRNESHDYISFSRGSPSSPNGFTARCCKIVFN